VKYNLPIHGSPYNTRVSPTAADTSSAYAGIGVAGIMVAGKTVTTVTKDARLVNCFIDTVTEPHGEKKAYLVKRPGFATHATIASGQKGMAVLVWKGQSSKVITAFGESNTTIYDSGTSVGSITGQCTGLTETFVGTQATVAITSSDNTAWYYDTAVGAVTKITDADFPGNAGYTLAGTFAHHNGYAFIATTDGKLWSSNLNSLTGWTANNYDSANAYPDLGVAAVRWREFIAIFGTESMQFFYNRGLSPFPYDKAVAKTQKVGLVSAKAMTSIADTLFWCGSTDQGGISVFQYDGDLNRISPPAIDAALIAVAGKVSLSSIRLYGHSFVLVYTGSMTYYYNIEDRQWGEFSSSSPLWTSVAADSAAGTMVNYSVSNVATGGKLYIINHPLLTFQDDGAAFTATLQTQNDDHGTNKRKFYNTLEIDADTESSTSTLTVAASDDDYGSFTTLGTIDLSGTARKLTALGSSQKRAWRLTHAANTPMRIRRAGGDMTIGTA